MRHYVLECMDTTELVPRHVGYVLDIDRLKLMTVWEVGNTIKGIVSDIEYQLNNPKERSKQYERY